jgi:hypothetical protein
MPHAVNYQDPMTLTSPQSDAVHSAIKPYPVKYCDFYYPSILRNPNSPLGITSHIFVNLLSCKMDLFLHWYQVIDWFMKLDQLLLFLHGSFVLISTHGFWKANIIMSWMFCNRQVRPHDYLNLLQKINFILTNSEGEGDGNQSSIHVPCTPTVLTSYWKTKRKDMYRTNWSCSEFVLRLLGGWTLHLKFPNLSKRSSWELIYSAMNVSPVSFWAVRSCMHALGALIRMI